jgi:predicted RNA-binding Zn ribbon-like protein
LGRNQKAATVQETATEQAQTITELTLLRGFRDIVHERWGYMLGRRLKQSDMSEKTEKERKVVAEKRKDLKDNMETIIKNADIKGYVQKQEAIKEASEALAVVAKPLREPINELAKGIKYLDTVAIPDALNELGKPVQPKFKLGEWLSQALETQKKEKKKGKAFAA